jgi:hypothetical protein
MPSVDALVDACMRVNTSGIRSTPTAARSTKADPSRHEHLVARPGGRGR